MDLYRKNFEMVSHQMVVFKRVFRGVEENMKKKSKTIPCIVCGKPGNRKLWCYNGYPELVDADLVPAGLARGQGYENE